MSYREPNLDTDSSCASSSFSDTDSESGSPFSLNLKLLYGTRSCLKNISKGHRRNFGDLRTEENIFKMANDNQRQAVPVLKQEYINMVPEFHGETELLPRFLSVAEKLF